MGHGRRSPDVVETAALAVTAAVHPLALAGGQVTEPFESDTASSATRSSRISTAVKDLAGRLAALRGAAPNRRQ